MSQLAAPPPPQRSMRPDRAWTIRLTDAPDALMRVLTLLHRRRCELLKVDYDAATGHRPARLRVLVGSSGARPESLEPWLRGAIGVLDVVRDD